MVAMENKMLKKLLLSFAIITTSFSSSNTYNKNDSEEKKDVNYARVVWGTCCMSLGFCGLYTFGTSTAHIISYSSTQPAHNTSGRTFSLKLSMSNVSATYLSYLVAKYGIHQIQDGVNGK